MLELRLIAILLYQAEILNQEKSEEEGDQVVSL